MKKIEKIEISIMIMFLAIGLIGPIFGMSILVVPIVILFGLGLTGLTAIIADRL